MAYGFLALFVFLVSSVTFLAISLAKGKRKITDLPVEFQSEVNHMFVFLFIFAITYLLRWISDAYIVPDIVTNHVQQCILEGVGTFCVKAGFISYYLWTSLIFDFLPLFIIVYFHHKSFRHQDKMDLYSQSAVSEGTQ